MPNPSSTPSTGPSAAAPAPLLTASAAQPAALPFLLLLFVGSGCSALIYEVVWFQLLQFAVGSSAVSIGVLLATFMGGMCLGSLLYSRFVPRSVHPLRVYALLELLIGILGLLITLAMPAFDGFYAALARNLGAGITIRALIAAACLLPPTLLMGATLPAISRWVENTPRGVAWLGFFYGGNTLGAVIGCLLAGFYLLRTLDMYAATYVAVAINLIVATLGLSLSLGTPRTATTIDPRRDAAPPASPASTLHDRLDTVSIYLAIALSGAAALGAEVIWTRLLSLLLAGTTYTFSIILAVFLAGLGIGSSVGAMIARSGSNARTALAWCQILCAISIGWTAYAVTNGLPNWPVNPYLTNDQGIHFQLDLARCCWAILPPTLFWGASFPLALAVIAAVRGPGADPARGVGRTYAANTLGAILGALFFSLIAIRVWGTQTSQHILIGIAATAAVIAILPAFVPRELAVRVPSSNEIVGVLVTLILAVVLPVTTVIVLSTPIRQFSGAIAPLDSVPWQLVAWGRRFRAWDVNEANDPLVNGQSRLVYMGEGKNSSVAVTRSGVDTLNFHVAGKIEASTLAQDMRLQLMLGHFPALFHPEPAKKKKVLIVGCGAGVTAGSFILYPDVEKIVICEIEPLVPEVVAKYFAQQNNNVVTRKQNGELIDPRVQIVYDDARHYILTTDEKFDIITSDPIHPWVKGAASLYTKEYFELVKRHLNPGGIVTQWVPLYESSVPVVKSEIKTFFDAFPNGTLWCNDLGGAGYDVVVMGSDRPMTIDAEALQSRMNVLIAGILGDVQLKTPTDVLRTYGGRAGDLGDWTRDGEINLDRNLRLQYLAGESLNFAEGPRIQNEIIRFRRYPEDLIKAPAEMRKQLEASWQTGQ